MASIASLPRFSHSPQVVSRSLTPDTATVGGHDLRYTSVVSSVNYKDKTAHISRHPLGHKITATEARVHNHDCSYVDPALAREKAERRLFGHFFRANIAYYLKCKTSRGTTSLTGRASSCGGCHGSHWNLTPNLLDDKMERVFAEILANGMTPKKTKYLKLTIGLEENEAQYLHHHHSDAAKMNRFMTERVSAAQKIKSFDKTSFDAQANSTIENPISSNEVDSRIEKKLRPKDDELSHKCTNQEISPLESTKLMGLEMQKVLESTLNHYQNQKTKLEEILRLNQAIQPLIDRAKKSESTRSHKFKNHQELKKFFSNIKSLLELKKDLGESSKDYRSLIAKIKGYREDYHSLKELIKVDISRLGFDDLNSHFTKILPTLKAFNEEAIAEDLAMYERKIQECTYQLDEVKRYNQAGHIDSFNKLFFGVVDKGIKKEPTDEEITHQILDMLQKETRSPVKACHLKSPEKTPLTSRSIKNNKVPATPESPFVHMLKSSTAVKAKLATLANSENSHILKSWNT